MVGQSFGSVAGIILIVAAGGGFKQTLVDSGIGDVIASSITESAMNPLIAGWLVAVLIRLATGSATVATVTASGIMVPLATGMSPTHLALLVLAIGAGSVFFSHLNDAGFWLVKEYFGMTVGQTLKTWSLMETVLGRRPWRSDAALTGPVTILAVRPVFRNLLSCVAEGQGRRNGRQPFPTITNRIHMQSPTPIPTVERRSSCSSE